jgi:hypothetical protein
MSAPGSLFLRLSVPAQGGLRVIATEVAARVAEYLGDDKVDAATVSSAVDSVAAKVAPNGSDGEIHFDFREVDGDLLIEARCGHHTSHVRCPLPA